MAKNVTKCMTIGALTLVFWIVSLVIMDKVSDRNDLSNKTVDEITKSWSKSQDFSGPIICVPVYSDNEKSPYTCMYVLPEQYTVEADVESQILHRGIFDASVYRTKIEASGSYNLKNMKLNELDQASASVIRYDWNHAQIIVSIGDKRGLEEGICVSVDGQDIELNKRFNSYMNTKISPLFYGDMVCYQMDLSEMVGKEIPFSLHSNLKGSETLDISPVGVNSKIVIRGNCADPSFDGMVLPSSREVADDGFEASWKINCMNRNDVDQVFYSTESISLQHVGVKLLIKGGQYTQTDRALKYAFLVILLSLAAVFVAEMCVKTEISFLNYLLIGAAVVLFYLLLLSISEWTGFAVAYLLSVILTVGMITLYLKSIVRRFNVTVAVSMFLLLIYAFIYVLLSIEDMSLLVGTLGLFVILGVAMFFSLRMANAKS